MENFDSKNYRDTMAEGLKSIEDHSERKEEYEKISKTRLYIQTREKHLQEAAEIRENNEKLRVAHEHADEILKPKNEKEKKVLERFSQLGQEFQYSDSPRGRLDLKTIISLKKLGLSDGDAEVLLDEIKSRKFHPGTSVGDAEFSGKIGKIKSAEDLVDDEPVIKDGPKVSESVAYSLEKKVYSGYNEDGQIRPDWEKVFAAEHLLGGSMPSNAVIDKETFEKSEKELRKYVESLSGTRKAAAFIALARIQKFNGLPYEGDVREAKEIMIKSQNWSGRPLYR